MNRAFISLYIFIVASVILIGLGLDKFWDKYADSQPISVEVRSIFALLEQQLAIVEPLPNEQSPQLQSLKNKATIEQIAQAAALNIQLLLLDDFANSTAAIQLANGEILGVADEQSMIWYKRLQQSDQVMAVTLPMSDLRTSPLHTLLLFVFYASIALVIYLWVWPLARDVKKLEAQTRDLGKDAVPNPIRIAPSSTVYPLAQAFNHMTQRLRGLINSHKEMTNAVSHELRTPLARMKFALAMVDTESANATSQKNLQSIQQDIGEMESLISALLMYAGFEQESQHLAQCAGDMHAMLEDIRQRFMRTNPRNLQLEIRTCPADNAVFCEWKLMETVVQNLINNAARYAQTNILIEVTEDTDYFCVAVEDDGVGIAAAERDRVFDSFVRLYNEDQPQHSSTSGFGLGLAIVRRIMKWHSGDARFVNPVYLTGARIELLWPKVPPQALKN